jgi:hypothetical protein
MAGSAARVVPGNYALGGGLAADEAGQGAPGDHRVVEQVKVADVTTQLTVPVTRR